MTLDRLDYVRSAGIAVVGAAVLEVVVHLGESVEKIL